MSEKIYVEDVGTEIIVDCGSDISTASQYHLNVLKPNGLTTQWDPELYPTLGNSFLRYLTVEGDFNVAGWYQLQAHIYLSSGRLRGETCNFRVYADFE